MHKATISATYPPQHPPILGILKRHPGHLLWVLRGSTFPETTKISMWSIQSDAKTYRIERKTECDNPQSWMFTSQHEVSCVLKGEWAKWVGAMVLRYPLHMKSQSLEITCFGYRADDRFLELDKVKTHAPRDVYPNSLHQGLRLSKPMFRVSET